MAVRKKKTGKLKSELRFLNKPLDSLTQFSQVNLKVNIYIQMINSWGRELGNEGIKTLLATNLP